MRGLHALVFLLASTSAALCASPAPMPHELPARAQKAPAIRVSGPVQPGGFADLTVDAPPGASVIWRITPAPVQRATGLPPGRCIFGGKQGTTYTVTAIVVDFDKKTVVDVEEVVTFGGAAPPEPGPGPKPPEPKPTPLTSFRVIMVYESEDNLTPAQRAIVFGRTVEDWLTANCTTGKNGWRRRDKDAPGDNDATMKALWDAVKPHITTTPCIAVERNGKVEIIMLESTPAAMVARLTAYRGGK